LSSANKDNRPIVAHLIFRFDIGGLERVMVNCINAMQTDNYQHVVIALTDVSDFALHLNDSVAVYQLNKKSGKDLASHWRLFTLLRQIKPQILHTYNLAALEYHIVAKLAGVQGNIHAEHGRDNADPQGLNKKHNFLRKALAPFIDHFVAVSTDLAQWLDTTVGITQDKIILIRNGINTDDFYRQRTIQHQETDNTLRFIHVARLDLVKDQANLIAAFAELYHAKPVDQNVHLTIVGDGGQMGQLRLLAKQLKVIDYIEFTGARNDIAQLLAHANVFVLSSIAEGIPMTVLEAMAASLPIISTDVGGLAELITSGENGYLVEKQNTEQLSQAMANYVKTPALIEQHGEKSQVFIKNNFSEKNMVSKYLMLYNKSLGLQ